MPAGMASSRVQSHLMASLKLQLGTIASVTGRNAFFPAASVAPNGTVNLTFDALTQPPADNPFQTGVQVYDNYFAESAAGGTAFGAPVRVSTASSIPMALATTTCKSSSSAITSTLWPGPPAPTSFGQIPQCHPLPG